MASKISYEISIDELTLWVKDKTGMSDKKVEKVVEKLKGIDFDVFLNQEIEYFSEEIDAESSDEEEEKLSADVKEEQLSKTFKHSPEVKGEQARPRFNNGRVANTTLQRVFQRISNK